MNTIIVNRARCTGCGACYRACFVDVIRWDKEARRPRFPYIKDCVQCGHCEIYCKTKALKLVPDYDSYMFPREVVTTHIR